MFERRGLLAQMAFYVVFLLTVFATLAVEMTLLIRGERILGALESGAELEPVLALLQQKVWLMLLILMAAVALVMTLQMKRVTIPLRRLIRSTTAIAGGDLSVTASVETRDELGVLAGQINDLAANYQELLLLVEGLAARGLEVGADESQDLEHRLASARSALEELDTLVDEFRRSYYKAPGP